MTIDDRADIRLAVSMIGEDAWPTGRLRMLRARNEARFQQEWKGHLGVVWLDIPMVVVDVMPPKT